MDKEHSLSIWLWGQDFQRCWWTNVQFLKPVRLWHFFITCLSASMMFQVGQYQQLSGSLASSWWRDAEGREPYIDEIGWLNIAFELSWISVCTCDLQVGRQGVQTRKQVGEVRRALLHLIFRHYDSDSNFVELTAGPFHPHHNHGIAPFPQSLRISGLAPSSNS